MKIYLEIEDQHEQTLSNALKARERLIQEGEHVDFSVSGPVKGEQMRSQLIYYCTGVILGFIIGFVIALVFAGKINIMLP